MTTGNKIRTALDKATELGVQLHTRDTHEILVPDMGETGLERGDKHYSVEIGSINYRAWSIRVSGIDAAMFHTDEEGEDYLELPDDDAGIEIALIEDGRGGQIHII